MCGLPYDALLAPLEGCVQPGEPRLDVMQKVLSVTMQDALGDYDVPDQVPEWAWVQANVAYVHGTKRQRRHLAELRLHLQGPIQAAWRPLIAAADRRCSLSPHPPRNLT